MIRIDMEMPRECHECPLQLRFKDGEADEWYNRRCVVTHRTIEYPRPEWCPLIETAPITAKWTPIKTKYGNDDIFVKCSFCGREVSRALRSDNIYCPKCGAKMEEPT